ncbi:hypothetical protein EDB84DRAFT_715672 [Lactarius hengduanensis]|nr:hypothetical protein EDB84DRAFT_715672 [Lactarius hengduanensis]
MPSWCVSPHLFTLPLMWPTQGTWRMWIIWDRNFWLGVPFFALCTVSTVTGYAAFVNLARLSPTETVFLSRLQNWLYATWALSIATQAGATLLIGYRFWKSIQWNNSKGLRASRLSVLWILVESGALYTVTTIFLVGFSSTNTGAIFAAALGQISALAPTLIIVRAGLKSSGTSSSFTPAKGSINNPYYGPPPQNVRRDVESGSAGDAPVVMHINQATAIRLDNMKPRDISESSTVDERSSSAPPKITLLRGYDTMNPSWLPECLSFDDGAHGCLHVLNWSAGDSGLKKMRQASWCE